MGIQTKQGLQGIRPQELWTQSDPQWDLRERKSFGLAPRSVLAPGLPFTETGAREEGIFGGRKELRFELLMFSCGSYVRR